MPGAILPTLLQAFESSPRKAGTTSRSWWYVFVRKNRFARWGYSETFTENELASSSWKAKWIVCWRILSHPGAAKIAATCACACSWQGQRFGFGERVAFGSHSTWKTPSESTEKAAHKVQKAHSKEELIRILRMPENSTCPPLPKSLRLRTSCIFCSRWLNFKVQISPTCHDLSETKLPFFHAMFEDVWMPFDAKPRMLEDLQSGM